PEFEFDCIIQSGTAIPGPSGYIFDEFSEPIPMRGSPGTILFLGANQYGSTPSYDIYTIADGTVTPLDYSVTWYDEHGDPHTYSIYGGRRPSSDHGVVAFAAEIQNKPMPQIYLSQGGTTQPAFENESNIYHGFFDVWYRNDMIVFRAYSGANEQTHGVYAYDVNSQLLTTIAENGTPLPDGTNSGKVRGVCYNGDRIAIKSNNSIYATDENGNLQTIANNTTPIPNTSRNFFNFENIALDDDYIYFIGDDNNQDYNTGGIFREKDGVIEWLYEWDHVYEETRTVDDLYGLTVCNGNLAFIKRYETKTIYAIVDGVLAPVIQAGDTLGGKTITDLAMSKESMGDGVLAFSATFSDDTHAIYTASFATVPEPSTVALTLSALLAIGMVGLRRRR
ncbi:MAG: PEP-CTERM sorting domain-containing protein, partial [Planctomycetia bacterium]